MCKHCSCRGTQLGTEEAPLKGPVCSSERCKLVTYSMDIFPFDINIGLLGVNKGAFALENLFHSF